MRAASLALEKLFLLVPALRVEPTKPTIAQPKFAMGKLAGQIQFVL